jgi:hypothetical protein
MAGVQVLDDLRDGWAAALPGRLLGLYVHGSLVAGDFAPGRSDLDLLAVLTADPGDRLLEVLAGLHERLDRKHPEWAGRIEVEYVSVDALAGPDGHLIARVSPGETLHLLPATTHRRVTWGSVHDSGRRLFGPPPSELLPAVEPEVVTAALLDHVRDWPAWVERMTAPGAQAYAVLTMCRAVQRLRHGRQLSKRQAADRTAETDPEWAALVGWARDWWYDRGVDTDPGRFAEVRAFVTGSSATILRECGQSVP